jgi:glucoamylase
MGPRRSPSAAEHRRRRRALVAGVTALVLAMSAGAWWRTRDARRPPPQLLTSASWRDLGAAGPGDAGPRGTGPGDAGPGDAGPGGTGPGTTAADRPTTSSDAAGITAAQQVWLDSGTVPGRRWRSMNRWALIDLRQLTRANGAMSAGAAPFWSYAWPRDMAFGAAALARTGHLDEAWSMVAFLGRVQEEDGGFEARYLLDGSGPPDDRRAQADGAGWALWAASQVLAATPDPGRRTDELARSRPMIDRCVANLLRHTGSGTRLPEPSPDYWEVRESEVTLGLVGPMLAGLRSAAALYRAMPDSTESAAGERARASEGRASAGERGAAGRASAAEGRAAGRASAAEGRAAGRASAAADRFESVVHAAFGPGGYQRYRDHGGPDASVTFLMPPFAAVPRPGVVEAWLAYQQEARRPAGGLAPGAGWRQDGVSWTPEIGLVAYTAAASGHRRVAVGWLDWLDRHRTAWGSLPEKVLADGSPAGPAPLSWTAATALLASAELDQPPAARPDGPPDR